MKVHDKRKRLLELTKYIITKAEVDDLLGSVKLNKILFLSDFLFYREHGKGITGQTYRHQRLGPVAEDMPRLKRYYEGKQFATVFTDAGPYKRKKLLPIKEPNLQIFDGEMIAFVDRIIDVVCLNAKVTGTAISENSHDYVGWLSTKMNEEIPYGSIFIANAPKQRKVTMLDKLRVDKIIREQDGKYGIDKKTQRDAITLER